MKEQDDNRPRRGIRRRLVLIGLIQLAVFFVIVLLYLPFLNNGVRPHEGEPVRCLHESPVLPLPRPFVQRRDREVRFSVAEAAGQEGIPLQPSHNVPAGVPSVRHLRRRLQVEGVEAVAEPHLRHAGRRTPLAHRGLRYRGAGQLSDVGVCRFRHRSAPCFL
jgi:hypothetical protein